MKRLSSLMSFGGPLFRLGAGLMMMVVLFVGGAMEGFGRPGSEVEAKLERLKLKQAQFAGATVDEVAEFVRTKAKELDTQEKDPARRGVVVEIRDAEKLAGVKVNLELGEVSIGRLLTYVTEVSETDIRVAGERVVIAPAGPGPRRSKLEPVLLYPPEKAEEAGKKLREKLSRLVLPKVRFENTGIAEAVEYLRVKSRELDTGEPERHLRGVNFVLHPELAASTGAVTLELSNLPMLELLRYVTELSGANYQVEPHAVVISPVISCNMQEALTRKYRVSLKDAKRLGLDRMAPNAEGHAMLTEREGLRFYEWSSISYAAAEEMLTMKNGTRMFDELEIWLLKNGAWKRPPPPSAVEVASKRVFPQVQFAGASVEEAAEMILEKLNSLCERDADSFTRINLLIKPGAAGPGPSNIDLDLKDVPAMEALRYIALLGGYELRADEQTILLRSWRP